MTPEEMARMVVAVIDDPDRVARPDPGLAFDTARGLVTFTEAVPTFDGGTFMQNTTFPAHLLDAGTEEEVRDWLEGRTEDAT